MEYRAGEFEGNFANFRSQYTSETEREKDTGNGKGHATDNQIINHWWRSDGTKFFYFYKDGNSRETVSISIYDWQKQFASYNLGFYNFWSHF